MPERDFIEETNYNSGYRGADVDAQAMVSSQDFRPQLPTSTLGKVGMLVNPIMGAAKEVGSSFWDQTKYGMNDRAQAAFDNQQAVYDIGGGPNPADMTLEERVQLARSGQMNEQLGGASIPNGGADTGTFKPVTFRAGTEDPTTGAGEEGDAGLSLYDKAEEYAMGDPAQFNYSFDPEGAAESLFSERSALLQPAFARQRTQNIEGMQGLGRLGLMLSGEGLGAGVGTGQMSPDMYGLNAAQSNALAQLSAQSTTDAFGQELSRAGLDLSQFMTNEGSKQNMFGNLTGLEALRQNYELAKSGQALARDLGEYKMSNTDNPWLTGLTSLGSSYLGTEAGGEWLSNLKFW